MRLGLKVGAGIRARVGVRVGAVVRAGFACSRCCTAEPGRELGSESPHLSTLRDGVLGGDWGYPTDGGGPPAALISFREGSCGGTARCFGGDESRPGRSSLNLAERVGEGGSAPTPAAASAAAASAAAAAAMLLAEVLVLLTRQPSGPSRPPARRVAARG